MRRAALALLLAASSLLPAAPPFVAPAQAAGPAASPDFNGDGRSDLAVGAPGESHGGAVHVLYGAVYGLRSSDDDWWHQDVAGVPGLGESGDEFGAATVAGDFDADGFDDLAIGVPGDRVNGVRAGAVVVLRGSVTGLTTVGVQRWAQGASGVGGTARDGNRFGAALAAGDFDADGNEDLAVGVPGMSVGGRRESGAVQVLEGGPVGLTGGGSYWHFDRTNVPGTSRTAAHLGVALAAGDFDGDGYADLAAGAPGYALGARRAAGAVLAMSGSGSGLSGTGSELWHQDYGSVPGSSQTGAELGAALATGDVDGDGLADLAIGSPGATVSYRKGAGRVLVLYGSGHLLGATGAQLFHQNTAGVPGTAAEGDAFGSALAITNLGDLTDTTAHLAVGVPGEVVGRSTEVGALQLFAGSGGGVAMAGSLYLREGLGGLPPQARAGERFGSALAGGDFDGDGFGDLAIGTPRDRVGNTASAGSVVTFFGWATPLSGASGSQVIHLDQPGVRGVARSGQEFGVSVAPGGA